ncbi:DUF4383 domain-containing protein [Amycolatopsis rhabdoformis]|uniref:DUF4383 domain-containing protein n=1 Tax=Amycolatopsis rhabdoformis TaxID=1448059 RepID=A0ABZ1I2Z9_9PSEU|nr:DUF4383 domain-containing protein [Amycolatopsis rhabdoformis]WSE28762.1 DUF4383 domain-containing protein [Amycolatopsis rhabdoformis]
MVHAHGARIRVEGIQPAQVLAALVGVAFLVYGVVGFARTGVGDFTGHHGAGFWRFSGNPMNNLVHVVTGVVGVLLAFGSGRSRTFGWLLFLGYGALFVWGLMITGMISANPFVNAGNPLDLTTADNWLHLGVAVLGLVIAMAPARRRVRLPEEEPVTADRAETTVMDRVEDDDRPLETTREVPREKHGPGLAH